MVLYYTTYNKLFILSQGSLIGRSNSLVGLKHLVSSFGSEYTAFSKLYTA
jgi:hypothetical protein